jgi:hypothetical protein
MAVGDLWDAPGQLPDGAQFGDVLESEAGPPGSNGSGRVRLALAKVLPSNDGKHRGARRRDGEAAALRNAADLDEIDTALRRRNEILAAAIRRTQDLYIVTDQRQLFRLAATDLFVERAQIALATRARVMWRAGIAATAAAVLLLICLSAFVVWRADSISSASIAANRLVLALVQIAAAVLIVFFAVRYLLALSRSFFRENVALAAREHALGFGRLYVYTNPDAVRLKDLQDAFGLDLDSTPIFLDIKSRETANSIYSTVTQDLGLTPGR